jgi:phosphodiesterase/alkaline phosphatase D-like protein
VNPNYLSTVVTFEYGTTINYGTTITAIQSPVTGNADTYVSANITGLTEATIYHFRLKAVNSLGTTYGSDLTFTTLGQAPSAATLEATNSTPFTAQLNGTVNANYLSTAITFEYGKTTSYGSTISAIQSPLTGNTTNSVNANLSGLEAGTTYHFRLKAVNSLGTTYGSDKTFITLGQVPSVTTQTATSITPIEAQLNGTVNANLLSTIVTFEYGTTTGYGSIITATQSPVTGTTNTNISATISDLIGATNYHFRVKAVNSLGTVYGSDKTFTTLDPVPTVSTQPATNITPITAQLNGIVNANYFETVVIFEYGPTTSYGNIIAATQSPVIGTTNSNVSATISGLTFNSTYHFRVKAVNSHGTTYGSDMTFTAQYFIGENIYGGIVFYIDGSGQHGLVCTPSNQGTAEWGCAGTGIVGADGIVVGTGNQNTIDIVNGCPNAGIAARICYDLVLNGYDDWYLPSKNELDLMYSNLKVASLGNFNGSYYWSSTEFSDDNAYEQLFINGNHYDYRKGYVAYVRAIRAF